MIASKANLTVVGVFVLIALGTLLAALAILAGRTGAKDEYFTVFGNVAGLKYGSQVLYAGYPIGQVEGIEPQRDGERLLFRVKMTVQANWPIPEDSLARSESSGLLSPQTISITAGRSKSIREPGATIPSGNAEGLFSSLNSVAGNVNQVTDQGVMPLLLNLNKKVDALGEVIDKELRPMLGNANQTVASVSQRLPKILDNVDRAATGLARASDGVAGVITPKRLEHLDHMLAEADAALSNLRQSTDDLQKIVHTAGPDLVTGAQEFRETMASMSRNAEPFAQNLNLTSRNLQDFSRQLRNNPSLILRSSEQPDDVVPPLKAK